MAERNSRTPVATRTRDWWRKCKQIHGPGLGFAPTIDGFFKRVPKARREEGERVRQREKQFMERFSLKTTSQISPLSFRGTNSYPILGLVDNFSRRGRYACFLPFLMWDVLCETFWARHAIESKDRPRIGLSEFGFRRRYTRKFVALTHKFLRSHTRDRYLCGAWLKRDSVDT